jgi:hypothetical protein
MTLLHTAVRITDRRHNRCFKKNVDASDPHSGHVPDSSPLANIGERS